MSSATKFLLTCVCLSPLAAQQPRNFPQPALAKEVTVTAIPGVIADGAKWTLVWQGNENADGIAGTSDGGLLFAQEQLNLVSKLDKNGKFSAFLTNGHGPGAVSIGPKNRIVVVERTCTDPGGHQGMKPEDCKDPTGIAALTPERRVLADKFEDKGLGRVNDLIADKKGGVYFTSFVPLGAPGPNTPSIGAFYVNPGGQVSSVGEKLRTNGIMLSTDEKTLYITNGPAVVAFDVQPDGSVKNQREFGKLEGGGAGDGMAIDAAGHLYVTTPGAPVSGIQILSPEGKYLGLIPTPRNVISVAFSGPDKRTLYAACLGALDAGGKEIITPAGVRNTAMSIYKIPMLAQGFKGRAK